MLPTSSVRSRSVQLRVREVSPSLNHLGRNLSIRRTVMTVEIRDVAVRCPIHKASLVHIPKPIADNIVVCPYCGAGGTYEEVVEKRTDLIGGFVPLGTLRELLRQAGYFGK